MENNYFKYIKKLNYKNSIYIYIYIYIYIIIKYRKN